MTTTRLAAKLRKLREEHEEAEIEGGELNLVPYLDIVTNVIMFLIMTTSFSAALAGINVSSPTRASVADTPPNPDQQKQDLNLTLQISDKGYIVACAGGVIYEGCTISPAGDFTGCAAGNRLPTLPKVGGQYDTNGLTRLMQQIKGIAIAANETKVIINANPEITYEVVVAAMDAIRADGPKVLFPDVLLSAGVN